MENTRTKDLARKVEGDGLIHDLFDEQLTREGRHVEKNRMIIKKLEGELLDSVQTGKMEDEICIRRDIGALRTIDYVYDWVLDQIKDMDGKKLRLVMLNDLERIRYLNNRFSMLNTEIDECKLKKHGRNIEAREMFKDTVNSRVELLDEKNVRIPEDYKSTRVPFK
jgi:hypothetical protein